MTDMSECLMACVVSGVKVGCFGRRMPAEECETCGFYAKENERRRKLPLVEGPDGLWSRTEKLLELPKKKSRGRAVIYTDNLSGIEQRFPSIAKAAETMGVMPATITRWINTEGKSWRFER